MSAYTVFKSTWEPDPELHRGCRWRKLYSSATEKLNQRFAPLPDTSFIPQLERIRVEAAERGTPLTAGDLIRVVSGTLGHTTWWLYKAIPPVGGFEPISRVDHLRIITEGIDRQKLADYYDLNL